MRAIKYICFCLVFCCIGISAQNQMTSSPYSMFGLGEFSKGISGQNSGMGSVAYGMRDGWLINTVNPAGLVGMDSLKLYAEASAFIKHEYNSSSGNHTNAFTGNFSGFILGAKVWNRWYAAAGISPYTSVGYYFVSREEAEGSPGTYYSSTFEGDGGLSKAYFSSAFLLPANISLGVNLNYIFGTIKHSETQSSMSATNRNYASMFYADFGLQYTRRLARNTNLGVGLVYGYKQKLSLENEQTITTTYSSTTEKKRNITQYIPQYYGIGASLQHKKVNYALDYTLRETGVLNSGHSNIKFKDRHEVNMGIAYKPTEFAYEGFWKQVTYKGGLSVATPYYTIGGKSGVNYRVSAGMALPMLFGQLNAAVYYDHLQIQGKLQQRAIGMTLTYTLSERLYKVKF